MADIKRYSGYKAWSAETSAWDKPQESASGEWVKYEDILPAIQRAFKEGQQNGKEEEKVRAMAERRGKERY